MRKIATCRLLLLALWRSRLAAQSGTMLLNAAGATFPYPIYSKWFDVYHTATRTFRSTTSRLARAAASARCWQARWISALPTGR